ncbi:MAG: integrin, partial [Vicinamibacterales bacterium]
DGAGWTQQAFVKASNTDADDGFGATFALWGDTLAVGACGESSAATGVGGNQADNSASRSGAVYVFVRNGTTWAQQAYLKASNTEAGDGFCGVALWGDTLAVGSGDDSAATGVGGNQADNSAPSSGAVYVFVRNGTAWAQQAYVKASNTDASDYFGRVALWGDTLAVSASGEDSAATGVGGNQADNSAPSSGAVYVFVRNGTTWAQQAYVKASNTDLGDCFGNVAVWGDTVLVGAHCESSAATGIGGNQDDDSAPLSGAVYVFQ